jgi:predicted CoA-binding protein
MQEGVVDPESARRLESAGIGVAMDRCILKDHVRMRR